MRKVWVWILRVPPLLLLLCSEQVRCQLTAGHRKGPQRAHPQQEAAAGPRGSWGAWGTWTSCSLTCGRGVQERSRPCLPVYAPPSPVGGRASGLRYVVSVLQEPAGARGELRTLGREREEDRPGGGRNLGHFTPGQYGYGRINVAALPDTEAGQRSRASGSQRQRRSPTGFHAAPRVHGVHRSNGWDASSSNHLYGRGYQVPGPPRPKSTPVWAPLYQPGSSYQSQAQQETHRGGQPSGAQQHRDRPYDPLPTSACAGEHVRYQLCYNDPCPSSSKNTRAIQCSSHNKQPFMGRLYEWEPFTEAGYLTEYMNNGVSGCRAHLPSGCPDEGPGKHECELNCRATGFRFYVRQADRVIDGTPCGQNETSFCVAGKCTSPGCEDYLGTGWVMDKCGVCGGNNTACKLVSGLYQHSLSKIGYHKIVEIPEGATRINVTEMVKSKNFLALSSRAGRSIINGNWAIDRPGKYEGGGTMFTYRRPNEITSTAGESFLAEGPTNEILDVYMIYQQPNPGIHYEYILPSENRGHPSQPDHSHDGNTVNGQGGYNRHGNPHQEGSNPAGGGRSPTRIPGNQVPAVQPSRRQREYNWKLGGTTECSASCGKGFRYPIFNCVHRQNHEQVSDSLCDSSTRPNQQEEPCNTEPCPAFWDIGEWSECSKSCGLGMQHRQVLCRQVYANRTLNVHTSRCRHLERPETASTCQLKICSEWQIRSEWTSCSVPCGLGQRSREVRCVSNIGDFVPDEECNMNLRPGAAENCDMGPCAKSWFYTDWGKTCSAECGMGVRTRGILCLTNQISSLPLDGCGHERPADSQVCNNGPCENSIEWFTGPWSQCSAECGAGSQQRAVVCLMKTDEGHSLMPPYECSSLDRPLSQQSCHLKACGAKWYYTDWSACSKTCEGGFRVREVRCLSDTMLSSEGCEEQQRPPDRETCNPEACVPLIDENCRDKYFNCNVVVQARLCVYDYYMTTCCASCSQVSHRQSVQRGRS